MDATSTVLGWSVVLVAGGGLYWYYNQGDKNKRSFKTKSSAVAARVASAPSTESKPPKRRQVRASEAETRKSQPAQTETAPRVQSSKKEKEEKEDLSWARELADKQKGTNLSAPSRNDTRPKTVKQGKANNKATQMTPGSSTTGGDADDDLSPAVSPPLPAVESEAFPSGNDVSDMLEPEAPAPGTLRITDSGKPAQPKPAKKAPAPQETKKDRQNKKKAEEKKLQREADEKVRKQLEEQQRRTARIVRGEPAKNGLAPASAPSSNAWKESQHMAAPVSTANGQLLDTLANENQKVQAVPNGSKANGDKWWSSDIPSEEEQVRILTEQDDSSWNTVATKKGKKKGKTANAEGFVSDSAEDAPAPAVQAPTLEKSKPSYSNGTFAALNDDGDDGEEGWEVA
jgi:hypothetical protein